MHFRICVYVPNNAYWVELFKKNFNILFGGYTCIVGEGGWINKDKKFENEKIHLIYSFSSSTSDFRTVLLMCYKMCRDLNQEAVAVEINNGMYLITQEQDSVDKIL